MEKIEYGDINKFLVSIGIVLIALSIISPFFYLKEDFGIYKTAEEVLKYEKPIQDLIKSKQNQIIKIQDYLPIISCFLLILGLLCTSTGLCRWFKRQAKIDEKFDKEIQKLDLEIKSLTPEEKIEKAKLEVNENEFAEQLETNLTTQSNEQIRNPLYLDYMQIEQSIFNSFTDLKTSNFDVLTEQKLGNRYYIDILLKAKSKKYADRIIEIKYFKNNLPSVSANHIINKLNTYISYYSENINSVIVPVLLIVYNAETINKKQIDKFKIKLKEESQNLSNMKRLKIEFIDKESIDSFNPVILLTK
jgi:hypothetical protein